ncbi:insulinase family protein [bacterium]|nr:insulinase family protein [bacterium]
MKDDIRIVEAPGRLTAILHENHDTPVVSVLMYVRVGSADETPDQAGLAHLHEHMIFKGTPSRPVGQIAAQIEGAGGDINAYTTFDHTCYYVTMASRFWEVGLDVLADALRFSTFDEHELAREIQVVFEEMSRSKDSPMHRAGESLFRSVFRKHPYRRPIIGTRQVLRRIRRADIVSFFRNYYAPSNMIAVLAGDFDAKKAERRLQKVFADAKPGRVKRPLRVTEAPQTRPRVRVEFGGFQETTFEFGFLSPSVTSEDAAAGDLAAIVLGGGESSRLNVAVHRRARVVRDVSASYLTLHDSGVFLVGGVCEAKKTPAALRAVAGQIERMRAEPVTAQELDKARRNIEAYFVFERETPVGLAKKLGFSWLHTGDLEFDAKYLKRVARATPEDIRAFAEKYLAPGRINLAVVAPETEKKRLTAKAVGDALRAAPPKNARAAARKTKAAEPVLAPSPNGGSPTAALTVIARDGVRRRTHLVRLENGIRIAVKETTQAPIFSMKTAMFGGLRAETDRDAGISRMTANLLTKGTRDLSADAFAEAVESIGGSLGGFSGRNSIGVAADFLSRDFDAAMELVAEAMLGSTFPEEEIALEREDQLGSILRREDQLARRCIDLFQETLYTRHPYRRSILGTEESVRAITRRKIGAFYKRALRPEDLVFAFAGDVSIERVRKAVTQYFGKLSRSGAKRRDPAPESAPKKSRQVTLFRDKEQSHLVVGFLGTSIVSPDRHALEVLNAVLAGQGGRLFLELRDRQNLAYSVTSFHHEGVEPGAIAIYIGTSHHLVDKARRGIWEQLEKICDEPVGEDELARVKRYLTGSTEVELAHLGSVSQAMALDELLGLGYRAPFWAARDIERVTARAVRAAARRYLRRDTHVEALITAPGR